MRKFAHARLINVSLWGRRVGTIIPAAERGLYAFCYDRAFVQGGIQIAPLEMPLRRRTPSAFGKRKVLGHREGGPPRRRGAVRNRHGGEDSQRGRRRNQAMTATGTQQAQESKILIARRSGM